MLREIPATAIEVQTGLWANLRTITFGSITRSNYALYSSEGYCFYEIANNLDEEGNLRPENERIYAQYMSTTYTTVDEINEKIVSVPIQEGYEIVSVGTNTEVM